MFTNNKGIICQVTTVSDSLNSCQHFISKGGTSCNFSPNLTFKTNDNEENIMSVRLRSVEVMLGFISPSAQYDR